MPITSGSVVQIHHPSQKEGCMMLTKNYNLDRYVICDLCRALFFDGYADKWGPHYCPMKCQFLSPISEDDVMDLAAIMKKTLTAKGLMVILKIETGYWT